MDLLGGSQHPTNIQLIKAIAAPSISRNSKKNRPANFFLSRPMMTGDSLTCYSCSYSSSMIGLKLQNFQKPKTKTKRKIKIKMKTKMEIYFYFIFVFVLFCFFIFVFIFFFVFIFVFVFVLVIIFVLVFIFGFDLVFVFVFVSVFLSFFQFLIL